ncbi:glycoside hydrolase family 88 protein [Nonomuraea longispora]|nr:glycoside hydrolase family 88 protein [Nonomuraea longispora]
MSTSLALARERMVERAVRSRSVLSRGLPHWASGETGDWTVTPDGDWTGGAYVGELWLAHAFDPARVSAAHARAALDLMLPRLDHRTAFKGFGFYFGAAAATRLVDHAGTDMIALRAARVLTDMYDERLGLIPLGEDAEEASSVGAAESSIDSLQAIALLFWAADHTGDETFDRIATRHLERVLEIHVRQDGSVVQSSTLDPEDGRVLRTHTHKGYDDRSTWGRAQGWAMLYAAHAAVVRPEDPRWRDVARRTIDWWIAHVPEDLIAFWDFDDPAIPDTDRDTAATTMAIAAALRLAHALGEDGAPYRDFAERTAHAVVDRYLTPTDDTDGRPAGMLTGGCFTRRGTVRQQDAATNVELVFGSYFLLESLMVLTGVVPAGRI